jgi:hypothetical protein
MPLNSRRLRIGSAVRVTTMEAMPVQEKEEENEGRSVQNNQTPGTGSSGGIFKP